MRIKLNILVSMRLSSIGRIGRLKLNKPIVTILNHECEELTPIKLDRVYIFYRAERIKWTASNYKLEKYLIPRIEKEG